MSLRQRHIDSQLAMGSQRLVESSMLAGQQGEGTPFPCRSKANLRQSRSQSFGQFEALPLPPLSSAVSHPSIICTPNPTPQSLSSLSASSSCLPSALGSATAPHSSHVYHSSYFQPMDTIPDSPSSDVTKVHIPRCSSFGYHSALSSPHVACVRVFFSHLLSFPYFLTHLCKVVFDFVQLIAVLSFNCFSLCHSVSTISLFLEPFIFWLIVFFPPPFSICSFSLILLLMAPSPSYICFLPLITTSHVFLILALKCTTTSVEFQSQLHPKCPLLCSHSIQ